MVKLKETNLDGVKAMARTLLFTDIHKTSLSPIVVQHTDYAYGYVLSVEGDRFEYCEGVHISPSFQCDQSLGHPVVLCYDFDNEKVWLEGFRLHETDEKLAQEVRESIKEWGIHPCHSWDDFNSYVQCLGDDAMEMAYHEDGGISMC